MIKFIPQYAQILTGISQLVGWSVGEGEIRSCVVNWSMNLASQKACTAHPTVKANTFSQDVVVSITALTERAQQQNEKKRVVQNMRACDVTRSKLRTQRVPEVNTFTKSQWGVVYQTTKCV